MVMWFNPKKIRHLVLAEEQGLGNLNPVVVGESIGGVAVSFRARYSRIEDLLVTVVKNASEWLVSFLERIYKSSSNVYTGGVPQLLFVPDGVKIKNRILQDAAIEINFIDSIRVLEA